MSLNEMDDLIQFLNQISTSGDQTFSFDGRFFQVSPDRWANLTGLLDSASIQYDNEHGVIRVNIDSISNVYFNAHNFTSRYVVQDDFLDATIYFINIDEDVVIKQAGEEYSDKKAFVFNLHFYKLLADLLVNSPTFCDYHKSGEYQMILIDGDGAVTVDYNPNELRVKDLDNFQAEYYRLKESFSTTEFQKLFKETVVFSIRRYQSSERFFEIIKSLSVFLDHAQRDYMSYLKRFSFKQIQTQFKEEREKYIKELESNLDLINKQILAFPLTFSASIFAAYQVKDKPFILILIFIAYSLYTVVAWKTLSIAKINLKNVSDDFTYESGNIRSLNQSAYESFETDFRKIRLKIQSLNGLVIWLRVILIVLIVLFLVYFVFQVLGSSSENQLEFIFANRL